MIPGSGRSAGEGTGYPLQYSWASLMAQLVKNSPAMWDIWVPSLGWEDPCYPLQYSGLKNSMDYIDHGVAESNTTEQLSLTWYLKVKAFYILHELGSKTMRKVPVCWQGKEADKDLKRYGTNQWKSSYTEFLHSIMGPVKVEIVLSHPHK